MQTQTPKRIYRHHDEAAVRRILAVWNDDTLSTVEAARLLDMKPATLRSLVRRLRPLGWPFRIKKDGRGEWRLPEAPADVRGVS